MSKINKPRGTYDLFDEQIDLFTHVCDSLRMISKLFNFKEIITPIFEHKELFIRNIGENSDIVTKEFYDFVDKSNRELVLRPENTVGVIRSVVENKMLHKKPLPLKFFYMGPMFRYERPQSGRNRQFYQFGIEMIGIKNSYEQVESLFLATSILDMLKIKKFEIRINYIGGFETRQKWMNALNKYFAAYKDQLTENSIARLNKNPLRILDDKIDGKKEFVKKAPKVCDFFNESEKNEFEEIKNVLDQIKIDYIIDETLVRGLDYYTGFVYEIISLSNKLMGQSTLIGGGKYHNITKELGENNYDCIGFGLGIDRILIAIEDEKSIYLENTLDIYFLTCKISEKHKSIPFILINTLRHAGYSVDYNFNLEKIDKQFKYAEKLNPKVIIIFGEEELKNKSIVIKDQKTKQEKKVLIENILDEMKEIINKF